MIIDCLSDLHGHYPELEGGDLLIVAGDLTARDDEQCYLDFYNWLREQHYKGVVLIAGNHDGMIFKEGSEYMGLDVAGFDYLCDSGTEFEGLKIWGSPWTKTFAGINPVCKAFTCDTEEELARKFSLIPSNVDILITHSAPYGVMDAVTKRAPTGYEGEQNVGSKALYDLLYQELIKPRLHVFGHIHEGYGHIKKMQDMPNTQFVNASHVNERYEPVNKPIRIVL